jgi:N-acetylglutamate synthase-like GNAT family acetyltransferase
MRPNEPAPAPDRERYVLAPVATAADWAAYHAIRLAELFEAHGNGALYQPGHVDEHRPDHFPLLLRLDGRIVGATRIDIVAEGVAGFRGVAIIRAEQRRGHGRVLNRESEAFARRKGARKIVVNAHPTAVGYWRRLGFAPESFNPAELVGAAAVCIQMTKHLT